MRLDEPDEAWLGGRLPISRLIQCSHREELVDPRDMNRPPFNTNYNTSEVYIKEVKSKNICLKLPPTELLADQDGMVARL